ncbi:MAG: HAMP domain-containing histidine kinase [Limnothrix sp. RL_2_0]|nr:HAMP domain-containing histidine kinase [Limnothrix sp. RL_2_0]
MALTGSVISIVLIILGAGVMTLALLETRYLLKLVADTRSGKAWRHLSYLMLFFLVGYAGMVILIAFKITSFVFLVMGLVFFFGACFVGLVVKTGTATIRELQQLSEQKLVIQREKETAEAIADLHSNFLDIMGHEFRTPLNAILGFSEVLAMGEQTAEDKECIDNIHQGGEQLLEMINQILRFSSIRKGSLTLQLSDFNLADYVRAIAAQHQQTCPAQLHIIPWTPPDGDRLIRADQFQLTEILTYLLSNAKKFTPQGQIVIAAIVQENHLVFAIQDTGIGITPEQIQRLFLPFSLGDSSTTRYHGGIGLGLILCQRILETMEGNIWIESHNLIAGGRPDAIESHLKTELFYHCPELLINNAGTSVFFSLPITLP